MPKILDNILKKYVDSVRMLYGEELKKVILYGSYARELEKKVINFQI